MLPRRNRNRNPIRKELDVKIEKVRLKRQTLHAKALVRETALTAVVVVYNRFRPGSLFEKLSKQIHVKGCAQNRWNV